MSTAADFDLGPLTWVKSEIDQALEKSLASLRKYAANPVDSNQIRFSQTHFHQAHGALQIVGLDGVTRLSEELDGLLGDIAKAGGAPKPEELAAAERAFGAITAYLDQLLGGEPNQPLRLFAVYGDVLKARGRDGADPVDLYYPDLLQRPPRREKPPVELAAADTAAYYRDQRGRYQRGLLKLIRKDLSGVEDMRAAVAAVEAAQTNPASRTFWWVSLGFFDALFAKAITDAPLITRLANRVEQQLKRLMEGSATVAERLMREALFAVARARPATEHVRNVQEVFRLAGTVPATFELKGEGAPQNPALRALRELVGSAKTAWNKVASGHQPSLANFREFVTQMRARAAELKQQNLVLLSHDIVAITGWIGDATEKASDNAAMEVATALLLVENAAENFANLGDEFAQQAGLMHQRLQAIVKGETLQEAAPVPVLDEMSRRAQERLLMAQVVSEIQASLRAIEQALDAFFRDEAKRAELATLDKPVRQVLGALTILNEDRAAAALSTCAVEIQRFAKGDYAASPGDFERVARTLSGLGFYVDALQHGKADFDQFMKPISAKKAETFEEAEDQAVAAKTVEAELEQGKKALSALVEEWKKRPEDAKLKAELKARAATLQKDAGLVADARTEAQAADILQLLAASDARPFDPRVSQVLTQIQPAPAAPAPSAQTQKLMAASDETIDAELLSVYLEEAGEVLATVAESLEQAHEVPQNMEVLRTIRRGFHTLKGSGRMVGLTRLGEAAWAVEQVMNRWLEEERAATPDLFTLVAAARAFFEGAVASLKVGGPSPDESLIVAIAQKVKAGDPLGEMTLEMTAPAPAAPAATPAAAAPAPVAPAATPTAPEAAIEFPTIDITAVPIPAAPETVSASAAAIELAPAAPEPVAPAEPEEETINVGGMALSPTLYGIFLEETRSHLAHLGAGQLKLTEGEPVTEDFERSAHTLAGIAATVRVTAMRELAHGLEEMLERFIGKPADADARALIGAAIDALGGMLTVAETRTLPEPAGDLVARLSGAVPAVAPVEPVAAPAAPAAPVAPAADSLDFSLPEADTVTAAPAADSLDFSLPAADTVTAASAAEATPGTDLGDLDFALPTGNFGTAPVLAEPEDEPPSLDFSQVMPVLGGAASPSASPMGEPAIVVPPLVTPAPTPEPAPAAPSNVVAFPVQQEEAQAPEPPAVEVEEIPLERRTRRLDDDIDPELLPIFLEEAQELVPAAGQGLRDWRANPDNAAAGNGLLRTLHTLKGSARMCGAMALGELTHHMESRVENALTLKELPSTLFDELEVSFDRMAFLYDRLVNPQAAGALPPEPEAPAPAAASQPPATTPAAPSATTPDATPAAPRAAAAPAAPKAAEQPKPGAQAQAAELDPAAATRAMLRVRADLIDRLVNEAGEVSIARSRIEGDMRGIKTALFDLTENVNRLRAQLREIEIQAEGQMQSRVALAQDQDKTFDPLEFDRFTRFQEITRMMAESVNDVSTVQQNLLKALGESEIALSAQARLTRGLQANLMRIRMVPFASISERLFRIVRQAAKETGKRAVLDIKGGQVEVDRSVLERITAPFEHLLRNSVAHGVEPSADRVAKGKPELGEIKIEVRQEGNEIVLAVTDDGDGLNYERIRGKAVSLGLLKAEDAPSDAEVSQFIFHPGFSTAAQVTQLAGRGVGMDVVKSEIAALGGRVELSSETGRGTKFTIYLPLTLAVTQAVMVRAGGVTFAIPAVMVEQVRQVKRDELAAFQISGEAQWQNRRYPFRYLPRLLGDGEFEAEARRVTPVMFVRTGPSMAAIQLDEIMGSQEIVVKNTGPLLARIAGITGATVLGTGEIVLIINPVILAGREPSAESRTAAGPGAAPVAVAPAAPVVPTVMIVDDSLTVRKITGRLLAREGYNVLTAKDGVNAMEQLHDAVPDVMLVDIEMPRMDGFDLTRNVRADSRLKHIPIIMITSRTADKHRAYAKEIGVNVYLGKPYQEEELLAHIGGFVQKRAHA